MEKPPGRGVPGGLFIERVEAARKQGDRMILDKTRKIKRITYGKGFEDVMEIPNLVDIQLSSYERFLQRKTLLKGEPPLKQGLEEVFQSTFPIESPNGDMLLEYCGFTLDEQNIKFGEQECKQKGLTYAIPPEGEDQPHLPEYR
jgi:DNA-directed RNA polymerase beta subunit